MTHPDSTPSVELTSYEDGRLDIDMSATHFFALNSAAQENTGTNLFELSEYDTATAYRFLRVGLGVIATHSASTETQHLGKPTESIAINGPVEAALANRALVNWMPAEYERVIDVTIRLLPHPDDAALLGTTDLEPTPVLTFHVDPADSHSQD